ncbi:MAG: hypothetical protein ONB46_17900 [candidate division KSB1 bacterium]|nr:hypothetical protein [candidate division KSB1 bacterium]MDZ7367675.1 hypothetical protein [candidate division KSB1 bacterium]MDZ7404810.1 hypothetical protein [candidate division KSB1 bacterium]
MVSLIRLLFRPFVKVIPIWRLPPLPNLRAHLLGLTIGLVVTLLWLGLDFAWFNSALLFFIFAVGTYVGGPFVVLTAILFFWPYTSPDPPTFYSTFHGLAEVYFLGYAFGVVFATFYNDLIYLHIRIFGKKHVVLAFAHDTRAKFNIIKSPIEKEEAALLAVLKPLLFYVNKIRAGDEMAANARELVERIRQAREKMFEHDRDCLAEILVGDGIVGNFDEQMHVLQQRLAAGNTTTLEKVEKQIEPLVEKYLKLKERKLYHHHLEAAPAAPYTIAFVANPKIRRRPPTAGMAATYQKDPIINDLDLFLKSVDRALMSLERDEVLGRPEIWSRIRVMTIFDPQADVDLVEEFQRVNPVDEQVIDHIVGPRPYENFRLVIDCNLPEEFKKPLDVVFAMTASHTHDRSSAYYADLDEINDVAKNQSGAGKAFEYNPDPDNRKAAEINVAGCGTPPYICSHDDFSECFGRVALSVFGARRKTFLHEFAHAMSSVSHGMIGDEYTDPFFAHDACHHSHASTGPAPFYINRIQRAKPADPGKFIHVHEIFAAYNGAVFHTDLTHPSALEGWTGYFPQRNSPAETCIMDREFGAYRFDKLISRFMYDRLVAKLNRPNA